MSEFDETRPERIHHDLLERLNERVGPIDKRRGAAASAGAGVGAVVGSVLGGPVGAAVGAAGGGALGVWLCESITDD